MESSYIVHSQQQIIHVYEKKEGHRGFCLSELNENDSKIRIRP